MARGSGSFGGGGGGGHSGGSFGGGHSGGGRSFGGRPSSSNSNPRAHTPTPPSHSPNRPIHHTPPISGGYVAPGRTIINTGGGGNYNNNSGNNGSFQQKPKKKGNGLLTSVIMIAIAFFMVLVIVGLFADDTDSMTNTTERTALTGAVQMTDYYEDDIGWITEKDVLIEGLENFYHETGVQPYVLLVPYNSQFWNGSDFNGDAGQAYLEQVYADTFNDEAHFIFAYFACANDSKDTLDGEFEYLKGYQADTIMDNEALKIFWGYFESYYNDTFYTLEEMFANTFTDTADRIMSHPTNGYDTMIVLIIAAGIAIVIIGIVMIVRTSAQRKREKEEYTRHILEAPLEKFGTDTSELEKKYQDQ